MKMFIIPSKLLAWQMKGKQWILSNLTSVSAYLNMNSSLSFWKSLFTL